MHALTRMLLQEQHEVKVLAINSSKCFVPADEIPADYREQTDFECLYIDTELKVIPALKALLQNRSYHTTRFYSKDFETRLIEILKERDFDIIQLETIYPAVYLQTLRKYSRAKIVVRAHNIEHKIWERVAVHSVNPFKRLYLRILSKQLQQFEEEILQKADGIECISPIDADYFQVRGIRTPVCILPFGFTEEQLQQYVPDIPSEQNLFSLASMNWQPNIEGLQWFLRKCWPLIHKKFPTQNFSLPAET